MDYYKTIMQQSDYSVDSGRTLKDALATAPRRELRQRIENEVADIPSLLGKTANFTAATTRILLNVMGKLAIAQSLADVRGAVEPYVPLIQMLQAKIDAGEIMSVQYAQGLDDEAAIFEGLEVLTKVARVFAPDADAPLVQ